MDADRSLHLYGENGDAFEPNGLAAGPNGALFGMSTDGGFSHYGAVFELLPPASPNGGWTETILHSFTGGSDGGIPFGNVIIGGHSFPTGFSASGNIPISLTMAPHGVLYGTTEMGGSSKFSAGAIFELAPPAAAGGTWTETVLYSLEGRGDGSTPYSPVAITTDGTIYGTTFGTMIIGPSAGPKGVGTVFELTPPAAAGGTWTKTILQRFGEGNDCGPDTPLTCATGTFTV